MIRSAFGWIALLGLVGGASAQEKGKPIEVAEVRAAAAKAFRLIQQSQGVWYEKATCTSCHHQILPVIGHALARDRGVGLDAGVARDVAVKSFSHLKDLDAAVQGSDYIDDVDEGWKLVAAHAAGVPASLSTTAAALYLARVQRPDGSWYSFDYRPPQSFSRVTTTAVCARAVQLYLPEQFPGATTVVRRAREWLLKAQPRTTEDRTFHLLGLHWTGADKASRENAAGQLLAEQRGGGWSQLPHLGGDAYSTGEALYALNQGAGLPTDHPAYQAGLRFLLKAQQADGSWRVESRLHPPARLSPRYFDTGFPPGGRRQYSSIAGTGWAVIALLLAVPAGPGDEPPALPGLGPAETDEWVRVARHGSVADLKQALDAGMNRNAATARGTTALMMAAHDAGKVKLLLDRGADPGARAESGFTALMVAARYRGNADAVRSLLGPAAKAGAKDARVKDLTSALFLAAPTGDVETVGALLDAGATFDEKMVVLKKFYQAPLSSAARRGDTAMVDYLLRRGADPNEAGDDDVTPLGEAAIGNQPDVVKALLARGARVNHVDALGMTPLLYAASIDAGDTTVVDALLAAGADRTATDKRGRTALELAEAYRHTPTAAVLAGKARPR